MRNFSRRSKYDIKTPRFKSAQICSELLAYIFIKVKTEKRRLTWFVIEWKSDQRKGVWNRIGKSSSRRLMQQKRISFFFFFYEVCLSVKTKTDSFMQLQIELKNSCQKQRFLTFLKAFPMTKDFSIVYTLDNE